MEHSPPAHMHIFFQISYSVKLPALFLQFSLEMERQTATELKEKRTGKMSNLNLHTNAKQSNSYILAECLQYNLVYTSYLHC